MQWLPLHPTAARQPQEALWERRHSSPFPTVRAQGGRAVCWLFIQCRSKGFHVRRAALLGGRDPAARVTAHPALRFTPPPTLECPPVLPTSLACGGLTAYWQVVLPLGCVLPALPWHCPRASSKALLPALEAFDGTMCDTSTSGTLWIGP